MIVLDIVLVYHACSRLLVCCLNEEQDTKHCCNVFLYISSVSSKAAFQSKV